MSVLLAIDPGPERSAYVLYDAATGRPLQWSKDSNRGVLMAIEMLPAHELAVEMVASYGMPVGAEVFETCVWAGRFLQHWFDSKSPFPRNPRRVFRRDVKMHLCGSARATDANVRQALIDRYGPGKEKAIGKKRSPGPLYGFSGDGWAALGVACTVADTWAQERAA